MQRKLESRKAQLTPQGGEKSTSKNRKRKGKNKRDENEVKMNSLNEINNEPTEIDTELDMLVGKDIQHCLPSLADIQNALNISEKRTETKTRKMKKARKVVERKEHVSDSSDSSSSGAEDSSSEEESSDDDEKCFKRKKGKCKSGLFTKASNARVLKSELHAHSTLDPEVGG